MSGGQRNAELGVIDVYLMEDPSFLLCENSNNIRLFVYDRKYFIHDNRRFCLTEAV